MLAILALAGCGQTPYAPVATPFGGPMALEAKTFDATLVDQMAAVFGGYYDGTLNPHGEPSVLLAPLVQNGELTAEQAKALDTNHDGALSRDEYVALAKQPTSLANYKALLANVFAYAAGSASGYLTPAHRTIPVSFGARAVPGETPKPLIVTLTITPSAFETADANGDGRLSRDEALPAIAQALTAALLKSPTALKQAVGALITTQALPWFH